MTRARISAALGAAGCIVLALTAALHGSAYGQVTAAAASPSAAYFTATFLKPLWLFPAANWIILSAIIAVQLRGPNNRTRITIAMLAAIPVADAVIILTVVGPFIGGVALLLSGGLIWASALIPAEQHAEC